MNVSTSFMVKVRQIFVLLITGKADSGPCRLASFNVIHSNSSNSCTWLVTLELGLYTKPTVVAHTQIHTRSSSLNTLNLHCSTQYTMGQILAFYRKSWSGTRSEVNKTAIMVLSYSCLLTLFTAANEKAACRISEGWLLVKWSRDNNQSYQLATPLVWLPVQKYIRLYKGGDGGFAGRKEEYGGSHSLSQD